MEHHFYRFRARVPQGVADGFAGELKRVVHQTGRKRLERPFDRELGLGFVGFAQMRKQLGEFGL